MLFELYGAYKLPGGFVKVFERSSESGWGNRLNVVDENNVVVGYDFESSCCENFGYYFSREKPVKLDESADCKNDFNHEEYFFDTSFCETLDLRDEWNEDNAVSFRLVNKEGAEIYLVLFNCHNGYYSHGFEMKVGDSTEHSGSL